MLPLTLLRPCLAFRSTLSRRPRSQPPPAPQCCKKESGCPLLTHTLSRLSSPHTHTHSLYPFLPLSLVHLFAVAVTVARALYLSLSFSFSFSLGVLYYLLLFVGYTRYVLDVSFTGGSGPFYLNGTRNCTTVPGFCCDGSANNDHTVDFDASADGKVWVNGTLRCPAESRFCSCSV